VKVLHVVGARPNFMKIAPIMREMAKDPGTFQQVLVHTGQHYDASSAVSDALRGQPVCPGPKGRACGMAQRLSEWLTCFGRSGRES